MKPQISLTEIYTPLINAAIIKNIKPQTAIKKAANLNLKRSPQEYKNYQSSKKHVLRVLEHLSNCVSKETSEKLKEFYNIQCEYKPQGGE